MKNRLSPSVLAADFSALAEDLRLAEDAGAESFHFDIMDGHFVPNLSYGVNVVSALRKQSKAFFDVHLMVTNPDFYLASCKEAGADRVSFHFEATPHVDRALEAIKDLQMEAGIALNPGRDSAEVQLYSFDERQSRLWRTEVYTLYAREGKEAESHGTFARHRTGNRNRWRCRERESSGNRSERGKLYRCRFLRFSL